MERRENRNHRLIRLIAAQSELDPAPSEQQSEARDQPDLHVSYRPASPAPSAEVSQAELRAFVDEELSEQRMLEIEAVLKRDPVAFERYLSLHLEAVNTTGPKTPEALRVRARDAFVGGKPRSSFLGELGKKGLEFLDRFLTPGLRFPAAGAAAAVAVFLVIFLVNRPEVDGDRSRIIIASLDLGDSLTLRGPGVNGTSERDGEGILLSPEQLANALIKERTVLMSETLANLIEKEGRVLQEDDRARIAEELNRSVAGTFAQRLGLDSLNSEIQPDDFVTVVVSEELSNLILNNANISEREIRAVVLSLSSSEIGLSGNNEKGVLYIEIFK